MSHSQKVELGYLSFAKGLQTEISPLLTPEDLQGTTSDELNMDVDTTGMVRVRRRGFKVPDINPVVYTPTGSVLESRYWRDQDVYVVISFTLTTETYVVTLGLIEPARGSVPQKVTEYKFNVMSSEFVRPSVAFIRTKCLVSFGTRPILLTKGIQSGAFSVDYVDVYVRDFKLLKDSLTVTARPDVLFDEHRYNLLNAGWYQDRRLKGSSTVGDPIVKFQSVLSKYPSNADVPYLGDVTDSSGDVHFDPTAYNNVSVGSSEAPRGHYIYNIRDIDRAAKLGDKSLDGAPVSTLTSLVEDGKQPGTSTPIDPNVPVDTTVPETLPGNYIQ